MAPPATADDYQRHYGSEVSEHLQAADGFRGARLLRRDDGEEVMFTSITWFTSSDPIRGFTERGRGPAGQHGTLVPAGAAPAGPVERGGEGLFRADQPDYCWPCPGVVVADSYSPDRDATGRRVGAQEDGG